MDGAPSQQSDATPELRTDLGEGKRVVVHDERHTVALHNFLFAIRHAGASLPEALQNGPMLAETQIRAWRDFGHDLLMVENGVVAEAQACGCAVEYPESGPPRVAEHVLAGGLHLVARLEVPDPERTRPMRDVIEAVRIIVRELGDCVFVQGRADQGPGALAMALRGYERFMLDLALNEEPELIRRLIDYCVRVQTRYALAMQEAGAHGTATGGLGVSLLSPELYRSTEQPAERRFVQAVSRTGFPVALHICGDATPILADMVATGAPMLELDYRTDLQEIRRLVHGRAVIVGPVNPELLWEADDREVVEDAAREAISTLAPGGGFILGPGCALGLDTPAANIHGLVEAARGHGAYRNDGTLA